MRIPDRALRAALLGCLGMAALGLTRAWADDPLPIVPKSERGGFDSEHSGTHDAANIRTLFWNYGMVGDFIGSSADLSVFHSVEVPKGNGMNYSDGITPF